MDNGVRSIKLSTVILIMAIVVAITFLVVGAGSGITKKVTSDLIITKEEAEGLFAKYNDSRVSGKEVVRAANEYGDLVIIKTNKKPDGVTDLSSIQNKDSDDFVNESAAFNAELIYDENDNLENIIFSQSNSGLTADIRDPNHSEPETTPSTPSPSDQTTVVKQLNFEIASGPIYLLEGTENPNWTALGLKVWATSNDGSKEALFDESDNSFSYTTDYESSWTVTDGKAHEVKYMTIEYRGVQKGKVPITLCKHLTDFVSIPNNIVVGQTIPIDGLNAVLDYSYSSGINVSFSSERGVKTVATPSGTATGTAKIKVAWDWTGESHVYSVDIKAVNITYKNRTTNKEGFTNNGILVGDKVTFTVNSDATLSATNSAFTNISTTRSSADSISTFTGTAAKAGKVTLNVYPRSGGHSSLTFMIYDKPVLPSPYQVECDKDSTFTHDFKLDFNNQSKCTVKRTGTSAPYNYTVHATAIGNYTFSAKMVEFANRTIPFSVKCINAEWEYTVSGNNATLVEYIGSKTSIVVPKTIDGYKVVGLNNVFERKQPVTDITFESGCEATALYYAFSGCTTLKSCGKLPATVTNMKGAFSGCTALSAVPDVPNSVTDMSHAFEGCTGITKAPVIGTSVTTMVASFKGCTGLTSLPAVPETLTTLDKAFSGCTAATGTAGVPRACISLLNAFNKCDKLADVYIFSTHEKTKNNEEAFLRSDGSDILNYWIDEWTAEDKGTYINLSKYIGTQKKVYVPPYYNSKPVLGMPGAFSGNTVIETVILPGAVQNLTSTFQNCTALVNSPVIPDSVSQMAYTFSGCTNLASAPKLPSNLVYMQYAFYKCETIKTAPAIPSKVKTMEGAFCLCTSLTTASAIPDSVTNLMYTFQDCPALTAAPSIGNGVTNMNATFARCYALGTAPTLPNSVTNMLNCFYQCTSLKSVPNIPTSVTNLVSAFYNCKSMAGTAVIYNAANDLRNTFFSCDKLSEVYIHNIHENVTTNADSFKRSDFTQIPNYWLDEWTAEDKGSYINLVKYNGSQTSVFVPPWYTGKQVQGIPGAFAGNTTITSVVIPNAVWNMNDTFNGCTALVNAPVLPSELATMRTTFMGCTNLAAAPEIPAKVTDMYHTFFKCSSITAAPTIPNGVTSMWATFADCTSLKTASAIPNSVTECTSVYQNCPSLTAMPTIGTSVTNMYAAFYGCTSMASATAIPNSVTNLNYAFQSCTSLTIPPTIGSSVQTMVAAFNGCTALTYSPVIPDSATDLSYAFQSCTSIDWCGAWGNGVTNAYCAYNGCTSMRWGPYVPNSVTNMYGMFCNCSAMLTAPGISTSATNVELAFANCYALAGSLTVPGATTNINQAFFNCVALGVVYIQNTEAALPGDANSFKTWGAEVKHFWMNDWDATAESDGVHLTWYKGNKTYVDRIPDTWYGTAVVALDRTFASTTSKVTGAAIPSGIKILNGTFAGNPSITQTPTIPNTVTDMTETFKSCPKLTKINTIPNSVTTMNSTFRYCTALVNPGTLPTSVTNIRYAYNGCTKLTSTPVIPASVTIMDYTFYDCTALTTINAINGAVVSMNSTFYNCASLVNPPASLPATVTSLEETFSLCHKLISASATGSAVTNMHSTYYYCYAMVTPRDVKAKVTNMEHTFHGCYALTGTMQIDASPTKYTSCFEMCSTNNGTSLTINYTTNSQKTVEKIFNTRSVGQSHIKMGTSKPSKS